ncbi:MAG: 2,3-diaminopropionate biosynthesis protein SbnB [Acidobacteria bacterium]|nr:2,3-diaminopropionate biosynthesis protein SbnB [Acidobacteriota bacterium]
MLILKGHEVAALLEGHESELIRNVRLAYEAHAGGESSLPHSVFLRFPNDARNRIIALPAYLGREFEIAGMKWVSSFPGNLDYGLERASAMLILNSTLTGRTEAIIEASLVSARRTAASAALAAQCLRERGQEIRLGMLGCGLINLEIIRFLRAVFAEARSFTVYDIMAGRAERFKQKCREMFDGIQISIAPDVDSLLSQCTLISFATTAMEPHVSSLAACAPGSIILHVSLRDLTPEVILSCDNVVDDIDHVCRAQTSLHLAEQLTGGRDFIRCTLGDILLGKANARRDRESIVVFSPFGLGILDLAVGQMVREMATKQNRGTIISSFLNGSGSNSEEVEVALREQAGESTRN